MVRSAIAYALVLLCGGAFYLFYPGYLSFYTLVLLLVLPIISLVLTLLARRRLSLELSVSAAAVPRGAAVSARLVLRGRALSVQPLKLSYRVEDLLFPQLRREGSLRLAAGGALLPLPTDHCGWVKLTPLRCALPGWLGVLSLPLRLPGPALVLVLPRGDRLPPGVDLSPRAGLPLRPRPGGGPGEDYELRPYRPGDSVQSIHWKLTAKQPSGDPILRETLEPEREALAVTYDHYGPPDDLDDVLDQLWSLGRRLLELERPFTLCWTHPGDGSLAHFSVDCPQALDACYQALADRPAPQRGVGTPPGPVALPGHTGPVKRIHLEPGRKGVARG